MKTLFFGLLVWSLLPLVLLNAQQKMPALVVTRTTDAISDVMLEMAYSRAIGSDNTHYHFRSDGSDYLAYNTTHELAIEINTHTVTLLYQDNMWQLRSEVAGSDITITENRLTIQRDGYEEWYINGPVGIQQGFTLYEPVVPTFEVGGTLSTTASANMLHIGNTLAFAGLMAFDASGQAIPVEFKMDSNRLVYAYNDSGATYPITIDPWLQQAKLTASDAGSQNLFGWSVAIQGDTAVIGATFDDDKGYRSGSAYIFVRSGVTWSQQAKLLPDDGGSEDWFGIAVAVDGDTALVGASGSSSAYVFVRSSGTWSQQAKLIPSDAGAFNPFKWSIALSGDTALIGVADDDVNGSFSGSVFVFVRSGSTWGQQAKLLPDDAAAYGEFGYSVALDGETALIGALGDSAKYEASGSAYVFVRSGSTWSQQAKLTASIEQFWHFFGSSVALSGDTALIGAVGDDDNGSDSGSAYVFVRSGTTWSQQAKLLPDDGVAGDVFGRSVALDGDVALVGAINEVRVPSSNSAYIFVRSGATWNQQTKLIASDVVGNSFGRSVALDGDTVLVGANSDDEKGLNSGSAYVFVLDVVPLTASAVCNGPNLEVTIYNGDGPFNITASAGINTPVTGVNTGMTTINGPEKWDDLTVSETSGGPEEINLGQFKCRSAERPVPSTPLHRERTTNAFPTFSWTPITNANNYRVFVYDDANAATRTVDIRQNSGGPTTMILSTPLPDGRFFWRVRGRQNRIWSLWSIRFTLFKDPAAPFSATTPMPTVNLEPPNNSPSGRPEPTATSGDIPTVPSPPNPR